VALAYENAQHAERHASNPAPRSGRQVRAIDAAHEQPSGQRRGHGRTQGDTVCAADRNAEVAENSSLVHAVTELVGTLEQGHHYFQTRGRGRGEGCGGRGRGRGRGDGAGFVRSRYQLLYLLLQLPPPLAHVTPATPVVRPDITHVIVLTH
jgi:hypothetical protein